MGGASLAFGRMALAGIQAGALQPTARGRAIYESGYNSCGCNSRLSEVRSGSFGVRFWAGLGPFGPQAGPKSTPNDPDRTSDNLGLQSHEL